MSYGTPSQPTANSSGKLNPLFLIVVCVIVFWFLGSNREISDPANQGNGIPVPAQPQSGKAPGDVGDSNWEMKELDAVESSQPKSAEAKSGRRNNLPSEDSDWSMQEMEINSNEKASGTGTAPNSKKTEKGDWAMEEIDQKQ